jgi:hypothetical protein
MDGQIFAQLSATLLAVCTPWIVVWIALHVATVDAGAAARQVKSMQRLHATTTGMAIVAAIATVIVSPTAWIALVTGLGFAVPAVVGLRALGEIDDLTRPTRFVTSADRAAALTRRKVSDYLTTFWRLITYCTAILGVAVFVIRALRNASDTPLFVPVVFAAGTLTFLWLYEVWVHQVATGPVVAGDARSLRGTVRRIFAMEAVLILVCLGTAHALLSLDSDAAAPIRAAVSLVGSVVAITGCALAVASALIGRRYEVTP